MAEPLMVLAAALSRFTTVLTRETVEAMTSNEASAYGALQDAMRANGILPTWDFAAVTVDKFTDPIKYVEAPK